MAQNNKNVLYFIFVFLAYVSGIDDDTRHANKCNLLAKQQQCQPIPCKHVDLLSLISSNP